MRVFLGTLRTRIIYQRFLDVINVIKVGSGRFSFLHVNRLSNF